ncbi:LOW QUALITY PROTEIN: NACHT, LRR and PYD domains-containing protein 1 [Rattus rattus]|uniref:LOW QUALITY PROTEIN: NACHT, LRR and PYD domains-containing protein 1 n=1 Tax=Rattus rattus TaxID=10117 RepID=UPI0013F326F7|nr:LOW QUALITY PROTEIN: NACHT, LRR and PYD domains-containing protein 1 [Rattus rattus]
MEESQSKEESNTEGAQHAVEEGTGDLCPNFQTEIDLETFLKKQMEMLQEEPQRKFRIGKTKNANVYTSAQTYSLLFKTLSEMHMNQKGENIHSTQPLKRENEFRNFTNLLLFRKFCPRDSEKLVRESWHPCVPEEGGHVIEIQDLFDPSLDTQKKPQLVILEGAAGIGKSTLARQVRRAWEEGQLYRDRFQHVFFFSCRELAQCKQLSLAELIVQGQVRPSSHQSDLSHPEEKLLFILDGIDEPAWVLEDQNPELCVHWSQAQPVHTLLGSLLGKSILPEASLMLTARTTALQKIIPSLGQPNQVEVLGFTEVERENYFYRYFAKQGVATTALMKLESNPVLLTLCEVPWVCWLLCTCLEKQMQQGEEFSLTSQTTTALCLKYLSLTIQGQHLKTQLRTLCSLAAEGICQRRTLFSKSDLCKQGLARNAIDTFLEIGVLQKQPSSLRYSFAHLCLQEFFAAMSYILEDSEERHGDMENNRIVETLLERYGRQNLFEAPTVHFLFGLLNEEGLKEMEKFFSCNLPRKTKLELLGPILAKFQSHQPHSLGFLRCLYENQETQLLSHVMHDLQGIIVPDTNDRAHSVIQTNVKHLVIQTDMELMVVTFCIQFCYHVRSLQVNMERQQGYELTAPRMVLHRWTPITDASWKILFSNLKFTRNLEELDLSGNPLSYSAVRSLCKALKQPDCRLKTLCILPKDLGKAEVKNTEAKGSLREKDPGPRNGIFPFSPVLYTHNQTSTFEHLPCRLVECGLTSTYCLTLASVLCAPSRLSELDLQMNDLGDNGVRQLCKGLRSPACNLSILRLDQASLSDQVIKELRDLEAKDPKLRISSTWMPHMTVPTENMDGEDIMDSFKEQRQQSRETHMETLGTEDDFWGPSGPVSTEVVDRERNLYRVQLPMAGSYHCPSTGLHFVVTRAVTIQIEFCAWSQFLDKTPLQHSYMVAGPLFDIKAEQGAVTAVYLPHFVSIQDAKASTFDFKVAHFQEHGVVLETPVRVKHRSAVLKNPSFSPLGVVLRIIPAARRFIPITSITLIYYHLSLEEVTLHLYLIPNDCTIQKAIDEEEMKFQFVRIHKPPPVDSLYIGSRYIVSGSEKLEITPKELELCYRSSKEFQLFSEIYVGHMGSEIKLQIKDKKHTQLIWEALLKPGDLRPALPRIAPATKDAPSLIHFMDQHREQLVARVTSVDPLLDKLHSLVLSEDSYEAVRAETTNQDKMRKLFSLSRAWSRAGKDQFYNALKETHPHLVMDLLEMSGGVSLRY